MTEQTAEVRPPQEGAPSDLSRRGWMESLKRTGKEIKADRVTFTAGALAYYWFLALFPAVIALVGVVTLVKLDSSTIKSLASGINSFAPSGVSNILNTAIKNASQASSGGLVALIIGTAIAIWSASSGMAALTTGLNIAYDVEEDRKFIPKRLNAFVLMIATLILGGIAMTLIAFGPQLGDTIKNDVPVGGTVFYWAWAVLRWVVALIAVTLLFSVFYYVGPKRESPKWTWVSPGGLVGTLIWIAASLAFSFYTSAAGSYAETYGAFAGIAVLILWLYISGLAILIGAELNAETEREKALAER